MQLVHSSEAKRGNGRRSPSPAQLLDAFQAKRHNESTQMSTLQQEDSVMQSKQSMGLGLRRVSRDSLATVSVSQAPRLMNLQALIDREIILDTLI